MIVPRSRPACLLLAGLLALSPDLRAQHGGGGGHGGGPGGGPGGGMGGPGGVGGGPHDGDSSGFNSSRNPNGSGNGPASAGAQHTGLRLGPPGRWWDDKHFAKSLKLRTDQQQRMDLHFEQNRPVLLRRYEALEQEQLRMDGLLHASVLDEGGLYAQIDRIAQARADLEKANTHYLLQIRGEMDTDQIARLEQHH